MLGESAVWLPGRNAVAWVDIPGGLVHVTEAASGRTQSVDLGEPVGAVVAGPGDTLVAGGTRGLWQIGGGEAPRFLGAPPGHSAATHRFNDATTDPIGRLIIGTLALAPNQGQPSGRLYVFCSSDGWRCLLDGFRTINGLAFSPDGRTLYVADSHPDVQGVWTTDYDVVTGAIGSRHMFADFNRLAGRPDGAAMDSQGGYWVAATDAGRIYRFAANGILTDTVHLPVTWPTRPCFGGGVLRDLYVTTRRGPGGLTSGPLDGALLRVGAAWTGAVIPHWRG